MKCNYYVCSAGLLSFLTSMAGYAIPFNIPQGTLPTSVSLGSSVNASYMTANNILSTRLNNSVRWFPPSVTQLFASIYSVDGSQGGILET